MTGTSGIDMNGTTSITITSPNFIKLTSEQKRTEVTQTDDQKTKVAIYGMTIEGVGAKYDCIPYAFEIAGKKLDATALSVGAYGLTFAFTYATLGNKAAAWVDLTFLALTAKGFKRVNSG